MLTISVPDAIAEALAPLSDEEKKHHVLTANGLTVAEEEELLRLSKDEANISRAMNLDEFLSSLDSDDHEYALMTAN